MMSGTLVLALLTAALTVARAAAPETFGKGVTLPQTTSLDALIKNPAQYEGKTVRVEGIVTSVCTEMGCWMALGTRNAAGTPTMRIKVDDGVIVFPVSAKGKRAAAQGVVQRVGAATESHAHDAGHGAAHPAGHDAGHDTAHPAGHDASHGDAAAAAKEHAAAEHMGEASPWQIKATGAVVY
jgi:hypothetical protein